MVDLVHDNYALGTVNLFTMIPMVALFILKSWRSSGVKFLINRCFEISSLSATLEVQNEFAVSRSLLHSRGNNERY